MAIRIPLIMGTLSEREKGNGLPRQCAHWLAMTCYFAKILLLPSAISILLHSQRVLQILGIQLEIAL